MSVNYIINNIWLGDSYSRKNTRFLRYYNIKAVVNCCQLPNKEISGINYYSLYLDDSENGRDRLYDSIIQYGKKIHQHIIKNRGILIHCEMGINRSAYFLAGYFILYHKMTIEQAKRLINSRRTCCFQKKTHFDKVLKRITRLKMAN